MTRFTYDERTERLNGQVSFFVLLFTQAFLAITIAYKRYILHLDTRFTRGYDIVLAASILVYWGFRLYLSGVLPVLRLWTYLTIYIVCVAGISIPSGLIHGWPTTQNWHETILPAALAPAVVIFLAWLIAYLGKQRIDREIE